MNKQLWIISEKCTGCGLCEMVCAIGKTGQCMPYQARISVWRIAEQGINMPMTCQQCENPPCAAACLMNVISKDDATGRTVRRLESCIGCRACQSACPFEGCTYDYLEDVVANCDHCGGDPQCVRYCPEHALLYIRSDELLEEKRNSMASSRCMTDNANTIWKL